MRVYCDFPGCRWSSVPVEGREEMSISRHKRTSHGRERTPKEIENHRSWGKSFAYGKRTEDNA